MQEAASYYCAPDKLYDAMVQESADFIMSSSLLQQVGKVIASLYGYGCPAESLKVTCGRPPIECCAEGPQRIAALTDISDVFADEAGMPRLGARPQRGWCDTSTAADGC